MRKRLALNMLHHYGVSGDFPSQRAEEEGLNMIRAIWDHDIKGKWRYVAREFKCQQVRDDCFAVGSTSQTSRAVDTLAVKEGYATFGADCVKAYYQATQTEPVCVRPPPEYIEMFARMGRAPTSFGSCTACYRGNVLLGLAGCRRQANA